METIEQGFIPLTRIKDKLIPPELQIELVN